MWGGSGCLCETFGLDPDNLPRSGTYTVTLQDAGSVDGARWDE